MIKNPILRLVTLSLGILAVLLGFIGIFLPLLPTTPFLILATILFNKSSPKFKAKLLSIPKLGPYIENWEKQKTIPKLVKIKVTLIILLSISLPMFYKHITISIKFVMLTMVSIIIAMIWTYKED